jgi:hypothetical protein
LFACLPSSHFTQPHCLTQPLLLQNYCRLDQRCALHLYRHGTQSHHIMCMFLRLFAILTFHCLTLEHDDCRLDQRCALHLYCHGTQRSRRFCGVGPVAVGDTAEQLRRTSRDHERRRVFAAGENGCNYDARAHLNCIFNTRIQISHIHVFLLTSGVH